MEATGSPRQLIWLLIAISLGWLVVLLSLGTLLIGQGVASLPFCDSRSACGHALTSSYATPLGIPLSLVGVVAGGVFVFALSRVRAPLAHTVRRRWCLIGEALATIGAAIGLGLFLLQALVLRATCTWCVATIVCIVLLVPVFAALRHALPNEEAEPAQRATPGKSSWSYLPDAVPVLLVIFFSVVVAVGGTTGSSTSASTRYVSLHPDVVYWEGDAGAPIEFVTLITIDCPFCEEIADYGNRLREHYGDEIRMGTIVASPSDTPKETTRRLHRLLTAAHHFDMHEAVIRGLRSQAIEIDAPPEKIQQTLRLPEEFVDVFNGEQTAERAVARAEHGQSIERTPVPVMFINGRGEAGAYPFEHVVDRVDAALGQAHDRAEETPSRETMTDR